NEAELSELMLVMQTLEVDKKNATITEVDGPSQKVIKGGRALRKLYSNVYKDAMRKLKQFIRDSGAQVPKVYNQNKETDLCGVWYAIVSDRHYQNNKLLIPCCLYESRVLLITHLHLLGGSPAHYTIVKKLNYTSYQQFNDVLPDLLGYSRCEQAARLGYSTTKPTAGPWKYQFAPSLDALDPGCWTELCEENYEQMEGHPKQVVFLIRIYMLTSPYRPPTKPYHWALRQRFRAGPQTGSRGRFSCPGSCIQLAPPCLLPGPLDGAAKALVPPTLAPGLTKEVSLPSHPVKKRSNPDDGQQESKKAKTDE
ncbi:unnamed protein product, partial [Aureobasidium vineae]